MKKSMRVEETRALLNDALTKLQVDYEDELRDLAALKDNQIQDKQVQIDKL